MNQICTCKTYKQHTVSDHCPDKSAYTEDEWRKMKKNTEFRGD